MAGNNFKKNSKGFTLVEILVVLGIFSIIMVVIINVFLMSLRAQRQASFGQKTSANLRYSMETIARQIRTSEIDYSNVYNRDAVAGIDGFERELHLKDQFGNDFSYYLEAPGEIKLQVNAVEVSSLTSINDVMVVSLLFYIDPIADPFFNERCNDNSDCLGNCTIDDSAGDMVGFCICSLVDGSECVTKNCNTTDSICLPFDRQPRVTIILGFEAAATRPEEQKRSYMQTTVSSRVYKR